MTEKELLNAAMTVCMKNGHIPLHKDHLNQLAAFIGYYETTLEHLIMLKPIFQTALIGAQISPKDAAQYLEAITTVEKDHKTNKPAYDQTKASLQALIEQAGK
jgi:hypothetical protein